MTDEELKAEAIEWAKRQPDFPKRMDWVKDRYESDEPPCGYKKLDKLFGSYNNFRREAGAPILKHNTNEPVTLDVLKQDCKEEMLSKNPDIVTPCWVWQKTTSKGYALKSIEDKNWSVHIYVHEVLGNNPNPSTEEETYTVDHICQVKNCINPDHLQWATGSEQRKNQTRGKNTKPSVNPPRNHSCLEERLNWYHSLCEVDANGCWIPPNKPRDDEYIHIQYKDKTESTAKNYRLHILSALQKDKHPLNREYYESFTPHHKVLHQCPVEPPDKRCCNPDHLEIWEGEAANRQNTLDTRDYHSGVRLKREEIPEIREIYHDCLELGWNKMKIYHHIGSIYEVAESTVVHAVKGTNTWTDVK